MQKVEATIIHRSKTDKQAEIQAIELIIKEQAKKLKVPKPLVDFDNALWSLTVKHLRNIPASEIERVYGQRTIAEVIQGILDAEKKWPDPPVVIPHYIC